MKYAARETDGDRGSVPDSVIWVGFIAAALITSWIMKAVDASHIMGVVPLGGFLGAVLAKWLWRARYKT